MKSSKNLYFDLKYASYDLCNDIILGKKKALWDQNNGNECDRWACEAFFKSKNKFFVDFM